MTKFINSNDRANYEETNNTKKILYIDDSQSHLDLIEQVVQQNGNTVFFGTKNQRTGIKWALENEPDLILLDIEMPEMDGYQVLEIIKNSQLQKVPVVAVSACAMPAQILKGIKAGFDDYITKPFDILFFNKRICQILKIDYVFEV